MKKNCITTLFLTAMLFLQNIAFAAPLVYDDEVMKNGGFEYGTIGGADGWTISDCTAQISTQAHSGKFSAEVTTTDIDYSLIKNMTELELDEWYEISVYIKLINVPELPENQNVMARFMNNHYTTYTDKSGNRVTGFTDVEHLGLKFYEIKPREWQKVSYVYTPQQWDTRWGTDPLNGNGYIYLQCDVFSNNGATGVKTKGYPITYLLDDFSVRKLKPNNITVSGSDEIVIPQNGKVSKQYGAYETIELDDESCPWFKESDVTITAENCPYGVSFSDGYLDVSSSAQEGTVKIKASGGGMSAEKDVRITAEASSVNNVDKKRLSDKIREAMYLYNSLQNGDRASLLKAINTAAECRNSENTDAESCNNAVDELNEAVYRFKRSIPPYAEIYVDKNNSAAFKTISEAKEYARSIAPNMNGDIIIHIADGEYFYDSEAEKFSAEDSGRNGFEIIYRGGGNTAISGGKTVSSSEWSPHENGIMKAYIGMGKTIRQLYVNGERAVRARSEAALSDASFDTDGYITDDKSFLSYARPQDLELVYVNAWTNPRGRVKSISMLENGKVKITVTDKSYETTVENPLKYMKYYENAYELLNEQGEWYYNSENGYVYYMPKDGETEINAVYPIRDGELFSVSGTDENNVIHDIEFSNLKFMYSTWNVPSGECGYIDGQDGYLQMDGYSGRMSAAVTVDYGHNIEIRDCSFEYLGNIGINMKNSMQNCDIRNNSFRNISANAVIVGIADFYSRINYKYRNNYYYLPADKKYYTENINICDNSLSDIAMEYQGTAAVSLGYGVNLQAAYNDIKETSYSAIHVNWGWEYIDTSYTSNVSIHHNYIENALNSYMADGGAIYVLGPTSGKEKCSINNNFINGIFSNSNIVYGCAVYLDEGSSYWDVYNNVIDMSKTNPTFFMNKNWLSTIGGGKHDNDIYDNFITEYARVSCNKAKNNNVRGTVIFNMENKPRRAGEIIDNAGVRERNGQ